MKVLPLFSLLLFTVLFSFPAHAAAPGDAGKKFETATVSFKIKQAPIQIAFQYVSSLAEVPINTKNVTERQRVDFACEDLPAQQAVSQLCKMAGLTYEVTPDEVIIKPAKLAGGAVPAPAE